MHPPKSTRSRSLMLAGLLLGWAAPVGTAHATPHLAAAHSGGPAWRSIRRFEIPMRPCDRQRTSVPGDVSARVMDLQGRSLKLVPSRAIAISRGELVFNWDGMTELGNQVDPAVAADQLLGAGCTRHQGQYQKCRSGEQTDHQKLPGHRSDTPTTPHNRPYVSINVR